MTRFVSLLVGSALATAAPSLAQGLPDSLAAPVDAVFAEHDRTDVPGCALGVYRDGEIAYARGYGMADLEHGVAIGPSSVFDIGSTSKQFTAASLILLEQQGALSLDDDVRDHVPELPDYGSAITLRHLLTHTSGLRDYISLLLMAGVDIDDVTTDAEALAAVARQRALNFEPGAEHLYSNTGYFLAAVVVERVSGRSLRAFAREHLFEPLGMTRTTYIDDHTELVPGRAVGYGPGPDGAYHRAVSYWEQNGDGAVFTTVEDLLLWDRNVYDPVVGGERLVSELHRRGVLTSGDTLAYAQGLYVGEHRGRETVSHGGAWGGYRAQLVRVPAERLSVAVLCNVATSDPDALAEAVLDVLWGTGGEPPGAALGADDAVPAAAPTPVGLEAYVGSFRSVESGEYRRLVLEAGALYYDRGSSRSRLVPLEDVTFGMEGAARDVRLAVVRSGEGPPARVEVRRGGDVISTLVPFAPWTPDAEDLAGLAGRYHSPELETAYVVELVDGGLRAVHPAHGAVTLSPREEGVWEGDHWALQRVSFDRGRDGAGARFRVSVGRARDLLFERQ